MENSFTRKLHNGIDFSVDHFIIDYAIGCGLLGRDYYLGNYDLQSLLTIAGDQLEKASSLQEGMQIRKNMGILRELFSVLPHTFVEDNAVNAEKPDYSFDIFPKDVHQKINPYKQQADKISKRYYKNPSDKSLESEHNYYSYLYYQKDNEFKYEYLVNLSDEEKAELNEQLRQNKIKELKYEISEKQNIYNRYSKMIKNIEQWNPQGENIKFLLGIKENMIKMLYEGISVNSCDLYCVKNLESQLEKIITNPSKTSLVEAEIKNYERLKNMHAQNVSKFAEQMQTQTAKKPN